jgi:hypothetical protein
MATNQLEELAKSDIPEVKQLVADYTKLQEQKLSNQITAAEFDDLTNDLLSLNNIREDMFELKVYNALRQTAQAILTIKSLASLI